MFLLCLCKLSLRENFKSQTKHTNSSFFFLLLSKFITLPLGFLFLLMESRWVILICLARSYSFSNADEQVEHLMKRSDSDPSEARESSENLQILNDFFLNVYLSFLFLGNYRHILGTSSFVKTEHNIWNPQHDEFCVVHYLTRDPEHYIEDYKQADCIFCICVALHFYIVHNQKGRLHWFNWIMPD